MKKFIVVTAVLLFALAGVYANGQKEPGTPGRWGMGPGMMDMEPGTQVIHEFKKLTGQILFADRLIPGFRADNVEYTLMVPMKAYYGLEIKNGETATLEGLVITVKKADGKTEYFLHPTKGTIAGKEYILTPGLPGMGGMHHGFGGMHPGMKFLFDDEKVTAPPRN